MADSFVDSLGGGGLPNSQAGGGTNTQTTADQLRNQVLSRLVVVLEAALPQATASISHSATAGPDTLPAKPAAFLTITVGSDAFKIPMYLP